MSAVYNIKMDAALNILESNGILSEKYADRIDDLSPSEVIKLYEGVFEAVITAQREEFALAVSAPGEDVLDPFTFVAGPSLRGDSGCGSYECRTQKLDFLGRYAALYANQVTIPLPLKAPDRVAEINEARYLLSRTAMTLLRLRPLVKHRIIRPVIMTMPHCVHTRVWVKKLIRVVHKLADDAAKTHLSQFNVMYQLPERAPSGRSTVYLEGPREFVEHGSLVGLFKEGLGWRSKTWKYDHDGKVQLSGTRKLQVVRRIFNQIAQDTSFYLDYSRLYKARLLTDLPGEVLVLNWLTEDERLAATTSIMESLTHAVPILADLPIATIIRIRNEERDSFESYRAAVARIASDVLRRDGRLTKRDARDILKADLEPALARIKKEMRFERNRQAKRVVGGLAMLAAGIAIGAFGGFPAALSGPVTLAAMAAGGRVLGKATEVACEHGANLRQQNDFYFLARLVEEASD